MFHNSAQESALPSSTAAPLYERCCLPMKRRTISLPYSYCAKFKGNLVFIPKFISL